MLVLLAFLPPPLLPVVAKLQQKPSALCEVFHFHDFPGGRQPSGWQFKKNKLAGWFSGPHGIPGATCLCSQTQGPHATVHSCPGRVSACESALLTPFMGRSYGFCCHPCPGCWVTVTHAPNNKEKVEGQRTHPSASSQVPPLLPTRDPPSYSGLGS